MLTINPITKVPPLKKGDTFIVAAISSPLLDQQSFFDGIKVLTEWGLICRTPHLKEEPWGYLSGTDEARFNGLHPKEGAPLITFTRGGWGAARLLEQPQPWKPGWVLGYSDITSILLSRLSDGFDGGIHGPLITNLSEEPDWSKERLNSILFGRPVPDLHGESWIKGTATGPLIVSNLTVGSHLLGSRHMPKMKGAILILEDTNEEPYRIDRMLTHWRLAGVFKDIVGLGFGNFNKCESSHNTDKKETFNLEDILKERSFDLGIPIVGNLPIGHCCGNAAIPIGKQALLNGRAGTLSIFS